MAAFDPDEMAISSLVGDEVILVAPTATLREVADRMADDAIGAVGVGSGDELVGVLTERDVVRAVASGRDPSTPASEIVQIDLVWTDPDASVAHVAEEMMERWIRHVFIGRPGNLLGIVSIRDVLGAYIAATASGDD